MEKLNRIKRKKVLASAFLAALLLVSSVFVNKMPVMAAVPSLSSNSYIKMYGLSTRNDTYVYTSNSLSTRGTSSPYRRYNACIYADDEIYVYQMGPVSTYVSYPTSSGRRYGFIKTSDLTKNNDSKNVQVSSGKMTTYRRAGQSRYGYVEKGDKVYTLASSNGYKQIIYPTGAIWKCGWVKNSDYNRYISESGNAGSSSGSGYGETVSPKAQQIANYALTQTGIGDSGGNNDVVYNTWYYGRRINGSGYAWCQAFVSYCADQIGVLNQAIPKTARCQTAVEWYQSRGRFHKSKYYGGSYTPKTGDLVFYTLNGRASDHVGIITGAPDSAGYLNVVEGNVLCRGGDYKVVRFTDNSRRRTTSSYVMGYASPSY